MLIEENNNHIYSRIDEGFNYHTSEEAREVWFLILFNLNQSFSSSSSFNISYLDPHNQSFVGLGDGS